MRALARLFLACTGWRAEGEPPSAARFVLIAAPHTSNWDLAYLLALALVFRVRVHWMGKQQIFRRPFGGLMRALGGIPVDRARRGNLVGSLAERFASAEAFALVVPAEGTRARVAYWKSGFYQLALRAQVPIVCGYLDYGRRRGGFGAAWQPSGEVRRDMDAVRAFYADKRGRHPERFAVPRLAEEDAPRAALA